MLARRFFISALILLSGCNLYRSSDRESFNSGALSGAPKAQGYRLEFVNCAFTESAQVAGSEEAALSRPRADFASLVVARRVNARNSVQICQLGFHLEPGEPVSDRTLVDAGWASLPPLPGEPH